MRRKQFEEEEGEEGSQWVDPLWRKICITGWARRKPHIIDERKWEQGEHTWANGCTELAPMYCFYCEMRKTVLIIRWWGAQEICTVQCSRKYNGTTIISRLRNNTDATRVIFFSRQKHSFSVVQVISGSRCVDMQNMAWNFGVLNRKKWSNMQKFLLFSLFSHGRMPLCSVYRL